jgi:AcrR family transcriptional regulator
MATKAPRTLRQTEGADGRRERILEAASRVFAQKGFAAASVDEIAQAAGIAKGTIYLYQPSKEALYWATLREGLEALCGEVRAKMDEVPTLKEKIRALVTAKLAYFDAHPDFYRIYQAEFGPVTQPLYLRHKDLRERYLEQVRELQKAIEAAARRGEIRKVPSQTAAFVVADLTRGVITRRSLGWSQNKAEDDVDFLVDFVWKGLAGK